MVRVVICNKVGEKVIGGRRYRAAVVQEHTRRRGKGVVQITADIGDIKGTSASIWSAVDYTGLNEG